MTRLEGRDTLWVIHMGQDNELALRARNEGFLCIGFGGFDASPYETREDMRAAVKKSLPDATPTQVGGYLAQVHGFSKRMQIGDPVVFPVKPTKEIAIGRVAGPYRYDPRLPMPSVREVEWLKIVPRSAFSQGALRSFGAFKTVTTSNRHLPEVLAVLANEHA